MVGLRIKADDWHHWRRGLEASHAEVVTDSSRAQSWHADLLAHLNHLECLFKVEPNEIEETKEGEVPRQEVCNGIHTQAVALSSLNGSCPGEVLDRSSNNGNPTDKVSLRSNVGTQLYTVRSTSFSSHVLRRVRAERSCKGLSVTIGHLAQTLFVMSSDFIDALCAAVKIACARHGGALVAVQDFIPHLRSTTVRLLFAELGILEKSGCKDELQSGGIMGPHILERLADALKDSGRLDRSLYHSNAALTALSSPLEATSSYDDPRRLCPFVCRRCRRDGREGYKYDQDNKRLYMATLENKDAGRTSQETGPMSTPDRSDTDLQRKQPLLRANTHHIKPIHLRKNLSGQEEIFPPIGSSNYYFPSPKSPCRFLADNTSCLTTSSLEKNSSSMTQSTQRGVPMLSLRSQPVKPHSGSSLRIQSSLKK